MADLVQGGIVALIGAAALRFVLRQVLRRPEPPPAHKSAGCGSCSGCSGGGCGRPRR